MGQRIRSRIATLLLLPALAIAAVPATPAAADYTVEVLAYYTDSPTFYFNKNSGQTDNSQLELYMTDQYNGARLRLATRAGSGDGSTDTCASFSGWLPNGAYGRGAESTAEVTQMYKTWGNTTVRGHVWYLNKKRCNANNTGIYRDSLFIHSSGDESTAWNNNWKSDGCIKISQVSRGGFNGYWWSAYDAQNERLWVS